MKWAFVVAFLLALAQPASATPAIVIVDPNTTVPANVVNGHLQMDMPSGAIVTLAGTPAVTDAIGSNGPVSLIQCDQTARVSAASASVILIAHVAGKTIYICSYSFSVGLVVSIAAGLDWGTGTACGTTQVAASPVLAVGLSILGGQLASLGGGLGAVDQSPVAGTSDFCLVVTGTPNATGIVRYAQF